MKEQLEKKIENDVNGKIWYEYHLNQKRQRHGSYKSYFLSGELNVQTEYKNNQLNGLCKHKSNNGSFHDIEIIKKYERFGLKIEFENK